MTAHSSLAIAVPLDEPPIDPPAVVVARLTTHHRTVDQVLAGDQAIDGDVYIDAHGHRWRVVTARIGRSLVGLSVECLMPPALHKSVILVGLRHESWVECKERQAEQ